MEPTRSTSGSPPVAVEVWAPGALFTRPELKVERVTYPVMTPSAAVGVLEAIYWKPEFRWRPVAIEVLEPIRHFTQRRNERVDLPTMADAVRHGRRVAAQHGRVQRHAVCLRDVRYRIHAHVELRSHADTPEAAYRDQFRRRVARGRCFAQPFLGTREFSAYFSPPTDRRPIADCLDLGLMLHSVDHTTDPWSFTWFAARLDHGVLHVPTDGIDPAGPSDAG